MFQMYSAWTLSKSVDLFACVVHLDIHAPIILGYGEWVTENIVFCLHKCHVYNLNGQCVWEKVACLKFD